MTTQQEEHKGLLTETTVCISELMATEAPTVCATLGKGIGMGHFIMGCSDPEAITLSWPTTQIAYLGPEGGAAVVHRKALVAAEPDDHRRMLDELAEPVRRNMSPWRGAQMATIDNIVDPVEMRPPNRFQTRPRMAHSCYSGRAWSGTSQTKVRSSVHDGPPSHSELRPCPLPPIVNHDRGHARCVPSVVLLGRADSQAN